MLLLKNIPIAILGQPSIQGRIYDMSLYDSFESQINMFSCIGSIGSTSGLVGHYTNKYINNDIVSVDINIHNDRIYEYDKLLHGCRYIRMYLLTEETHTGMQEHEMYVNGILGLFLSDTPAWYELRS